MKRNGGAISYWGSGWGSWWALGVLLGLALSGGCRGEAPEGGKGGPEGGRRAAGEAEAPPWAGAQQQRGGADTAVPVEVVLAERRSISSYLETNGALEAENDVNIVARTAGPVVELAVEEGMRVEKDQLLLKIDEKERRAQVEIAKVTLDEARRAHQRAKAARESEIVSQEVYDQALARMESAEAQLNAAQVLFEYTRVTAPFDGVVAERYVKLGENVTVNQNLFRVTDFDPLLCKIQVPEKELSRLRRGQRAYLEVEAWPGERFTADVLRISPVVDATTGTIRVTLQVRTEGKLSPGMFASVYLETETRANALAVPKRALSLESLNDTVFVADGGEAKRRELSLGFEERDFVEVVSGLDEGERVIVVGQDGLTDGTPVSILKGPGAEAAPPPPRRADRPEGAPPAGGFGRRRGEGFDPSKMTPEQLERVKQRMRERGLSEEEIQQRLSRPREGQKQ